MDFALSPGLDVRLLAKRFAETGRVQIPAFVREEDAAALYRHVRGRRDWRQVVNSGDKFFELDRAQRAALSEEEAARLDDAVYAGARSGFQYRYEAIRVADDRRELAEPLDAFGAFLSAGRARDFLRKVTGKTQIEFADAQATAFSPGDFLTGHDDEVSGKNRLAAYVLSLSPGWRVEWGGLLQFHGENGAVEGYAPLFGALNLFAVPQIHSVSIVTKAAALRRYSITGWLCGRKQASS